MDKAKLVCLICGSPLAIAENQCSCRACGAAWPIEGGIPRLGSGRYWGEMAQEEARALVSDAQQSSWRTAVGKRFPDGDMRAYIFDLQRAAWLPLLGLDRTSVALDIGSGLGAITHAMACSVGQVYSLEAVPERIEFTQTRLRQEGLDNVQLVQCSALSLPFPTGTFDLVVINGVLEWVGEWDLEGTPRSAQLRFLRDALRLLKPTGVAVIGIENRFAYNYFLGADDHSGLPYTSLMPRRLATHWLRRSAARHYRTRLNPRREYRTYTYSARGYRKLLTEAGFSSASVLWADPGYNQPHNLIPLGAAQLLREYWRDVLDRPGVVRPHSPVHLLKRLAYRLPGLANILPDFVIFAGREGFEGGALSQWWLEMLRSHDSAHSPGPAARPELASQTAPYSSKQVLRLWRPEWARGRAVGKAEVRTTGQSPGSPEYANLLRVAEHLRQQAPAIVTVPQPLGAIRLGSASVCLEGAAPGTQFSRTVWHAGYYHDLARVRRDFSRAVRACVELTHSLALLNETEPMDASWLDMATLSPRLAENTRGFAPCDTLRTGPLKTGWVQHGDFTTENVFFEPGSDRIAVIDWASLASGMPPLFDLFSLVLSSGYRRPGAGDTPIAERGGHLLASFVDLFFPASGPVPEIMAELIIDATRQLGVEPRLIPELLLEYLVVRTHSFRARGSRGAEASHLRMLEYLVAEPGRKVLGRFPLPQRARGQAG